jgi:hypothetical protein
MPFPRIFYIFETYPDADFGTPGPLVHLLEKHPGAYENELEDSLQRRPSPHPVWMLNRILNLHLTPERRRHLLNLLQSVIANPRASDSAKSNAEYFLENQISRTS